MELKYIDGAVAVVDDNGKEVLMSMDTLSGLPGILEPIKDKNGIDFETLRHFFSEVIVHGPCKVRISVNLFNTSESITRLAHYRNAIDGIELDFDQDSVGSVGFLEIEPDAFKPFLIEFDRLGYDLHIERIEPVN